jgi:putative multiple sugar transport system permease protein
MIKGLVLLFAVGIDVWNKQQGRPSIIGYLTRRFGRKDDPDTAFLTAQNLPTSQKYEAPAVDSTRGK